MRSHPCSRKRKLQSSRSRRGEDDSICEHHAAEACGVLACVEEEYILCSEAGGSPTDCSLKAEMKCDGPWCFDELHGACLEGGNDESICWFKAKYECGGFDDEAKCVDMYDGFAACMKKVDDDEVCWFKVHDHCGWTHRGLEDGCDLASEALADCVADTSDETMCALGLAVECAARLRTSAEPASVLGESIRN